MPNYSRGGGGNYDDRRAPPRRDYQNQFPNSGSMHIREKRSEKAPDMGGDFTITGEVLDYVLKEAERGDTVKLEVSGWKRMSRNNTAFMSLAINTPYEYRQQNQNPGYRQSYPNRGSGQNVRRQAEFPLDEGQRQPMSQRGGYAEQSRGGRMRVEDIPDFMRDDRQDRRQERTGFERDLDDEIPF